MQTNVILSDKTAQSVDARVDKILKDLGNPKPPLNLGNVRELLKLDLGYYSTADTSWLSEKIHQLKVAGKQVLLRRVCKERLLLIQLKEVMAEDHRTALQGLYNFPGFSH